tara:strand:- start:731 stop:1111 length:381 start_codon:yes stop_codon:yes gene_type:complete
MGIFSKRKPPVIDRRQSLASVPVRNESVTVVEPEEDGPTIVKVKLSRGLYFLDRFRPPIMEQRYELDELGAYTFNSVDGEKTVRDIVDKFIEDYGLNRREAELSVVSFLKMLMQRQIISIVIGADE